MIIKNYLDKKPNIDKDAYLAENCTIVGDVVLEKDVNIWYGAVIRADADNVTIKEGSNIQDNVVVHCNYGRPTIVEKHVSVGHGAILHGCKIGENTLIGMNVTILDNAVIGKNCIIGANALVSSGSIIPDNSLVVGVPAKVIRTIKDSELEYNINNYKHYVETSHIQLKKDQD